LAYRVKRADKLGAVSLVGVAIVSPGTANIDSLQNAVAAIGIVQRVGHGLSAICSIAIRGCVPWWRNCSDISLVIIARAS
jgi:hypothetical protein